MITRKCAPALAAGCTVVAKPASFAVLGAGLAELAERAGIPKGVFNVVTGDARTVGGELTGNDVVRKLSFTGSTEVGKILLKQCADTVKKVSMELGGHAPLIIFDDADLDAAVKGAIAQVPQQRPDLRVHQPHLRAGQDLRPFAARFTEAVKALKVGVGLESGVEQGPLIEPAAVDKVERHVEDARGKGAKVLTGGKRHALGGQFYEPTVLSECTEDMVITHEETFGPVAPALQVQGRGRGDPAREQDRVRPCELLLRARRRARVPRRGARGRHRQHQRGHLLDRGGALGGYKHSGIGREGSKYGIDEYLEIKYVNLGGVQ